MKCEHMIPNAYEQSFDMRILCRFIDMEVEILQYFTDHILDCYSPEHCPENLLKNLAAHIGFSYQELKSVLYNRVVLKNFIRNLIRYRGSATGIRNAAAIDIRYRQTYPDSYFDSETGTWVDDPDAGTLIPMTYNESIDISKTWLDVDHQANIIYLFVVAGDYFPAIDGDMTEEEKQANYQERMRRLLDLSYLQEYVRPVGMYLLPFVARKVNPRTDLTVKSVRIPDYELNTRNAVLGVPNASMQHEYDRMLFARTEDYKDVSVEPWLRTLYHSQVAGNTNRQYFTKPVYHIEGKFLYYDHDELLDVYSQIMDSPAGTNGMKVGDSLYNPNRLNGGQDYSYGADPANEPKPIQDTPVLYTDGPLPYRDNVGFPVRRVYQSESYVAKPILTEPTEPFPIYLDANVYEFDWEVLLATEDYYVLDTEDNITLAVHMSGGSSGYLADAYTGTHSGGTVIDNGTNKNLMINLFTVDEEGNSEYTGVADVHISGKGLIPNSPVPYQVLYNDSPNGDDIYWTVNNEPEDNPEPLIP